MRGVRTPNTVRTWAYERYTALFCARECNIKQSSLLLIVDARTRFFGYGSWGNRPSSSPVIKTCPNSRPFAACIVIRTHRRVVFSVRWSSSSWSVASDDSSRSFKRPSGVGWPSYRSVRKGHELLHVFEAFPVLFRCRRIDFLRCLNARARTRAPRLPCVWRYVHGYLRVLKRTHLLLFAPLPVSACRPSRSSSVNGHFADTARGIVDDA